MQVAETKQNLGLFRKYIYEIMLILLIALVYLVGKAYKEAQDKHENALEGDKVMMREIIVNNTKAIENNTNATRESTELIKTVILQGNNNFFKPKK